ncbi:dynein axonemal intermediate chain 4 [Brienomyrus brachyistius]|uniref:dynein axonemal intermediate chain 4 n=1 Tax=Brienomyrus brachyistius TaxID=42636 RepID=UPI0020B3A861|nr:dynein axonemal intermediate chain 4 [Brienomyrus brachyistius]
MSTGTEKLRKATLKVTPSSRKMAGSTSGLLRVNTRSTAASRSRKSFSLAGDSRLLEKGPVPVTGQGVQVLDENGNDVTPRPLCHPDPAAAQPRQTKIFAAQDTSGASVSDFLSTTFQTTKTSFAGPFTRSVFESSAMSRSSQSTMESLNDEIEDSSTKCAISVSLSDLQVKKEEGKEVMREDMLDDVVEKYLTETATFWLLDMPAVSVSVDAAEAESVEERNRAYVGLCKNRMGNDKYVERGMQTINGALKTKEVQSEAVSLADAAVMATTWDMYDTYSSDGGVGETTESADQSSSPDIILSQSHESSKTAERTMSVLSSTSMASTSSSQKETAAVITPSEDKASPQLVLQTEKFQQDLCVMERVVLQNIFQARLAAYRRLPVLKDPDTLHKPSETPGAEMDAVPPAPALELLWSFSCELTVGQNVSSMAWNKKNPDLLAVGYGQFDLKNRKPGLVCCWSLKNPVWPERIFPCQSGVTALDFSARHPGQIAVGMSDGSIATFSVPSREGGPVLDSSESPHKHSGPVWQVKWIDQDRGPWGEEKCETLVSVSADGRISRWILRKGLHCMDLIKLKRIENEAVRRHGGERQRRSEACISRQTAGLCFDFHPKDSNIYLVGTEEGHIHKCSCSNNEQYLETYTSHKGPVYKVTWSPSCSDVFLSCSSDWTIRLWRQDLLTPVLVFNSVHRAVFDLSWSLRWATIFAAVNEDRLEIWDLGASILDPTIVSPTRPGVKLTSLLSATQTDCVLLGDSDGHVGVCQLNNLGAGDPQAAALEEIIRTALHSNRN